MRQKQDLVSQKEINWSQGKLLRQALKDVAQMKAEIKRMKLLRARYIGFRQRSLDVYRRDVHVEEIFKRTYAIGVGNQYFHEDDCYT